jgi:polar amino acid transport system substrate-binding protein
MISRRTIFSGAVVLATAISCLAGTTSAADKSVSIATLDWPPYTGSKLPSGGATTVIVSTALAKAGYEANVVYVPWKRAIDMASKGTDDVIAYFPGYHCDHREGFMASNPLGNGPLGFAEHVEAPIAWKSLDDLGEQELKIGTVLGYANTDEFDAKAGTGWIRAIPANDDMTNLKKLLRKRIDAVVIDKFVLNYLKATEASLKSAADKLRFNAKPLEDKTLYFCVRASDDLKPLLNAFNAGLAQIDSEAIVDAYFATAFQ